MSYTDDVVENIAQMLEAGSTADGEPNSLTHVPEQDPDIQRSQLANDMGGGEENEDVDDAVVTDELDEAFNLVDEVLDEQDSVYQKYFRSVMKKHGITQIKTMGPEQKKAFFKDVSDGWRGRKKVKEQTNHGMATGLTPSKTRQQHAGLNKRNVRDINRAPKGHESQVGKGTTSGEVEESALYEEYKKYFQFMMEKCGIEDFDALSELEQAEFMSLVNEAFMTMNELMQAPGAPIQNPMSTHSNMIQAMKKRRQASAGQRLSHAGAAKAMRRVPTTTYGAGAIRR